MTYTQLKNEIYGWNNYEYWRYKGNFKHFWEYVDQCLEDDYEFVIEDYGYEIKDCEYYIEMAKCAIKRYPTKEIFKRHLATYEELKEEYMEKINEDICKKNEIIDKAFRKLRRYQEKKDELREEAVEWQRDFNNHSYYMSEILEWNNHFEKLGRRYGLLKEFRENGII